MNYSIDYKSLCDLEEGRISIPQDRLEKVVTFISNRRDNNFFRVKDWKVRGIYIVGTWGRRKAKFPMSFLFMSDDMLSYEEKVHHYNDYWYNKQTEKWYFGDGKNVTC